MTILVAVLVFLSFFQTTLVPGDLVLLTLICRSFIVEDTANYWLAFAFGLLLSMLLGQPLGVLSLIYLSCIKIVQIVKQASFLSNWLVILPLSAILLLLEKILEQLVFHQTVSLGSVLIQLLLVLPIYFSVRFWEERFIPKNDVKLKVRR